MNKNNTEHKINISRETIIRGLGILVGALFVLSPFYAFLNHREMSFDYLVEAIPMGIAFLIYGFSEKDLYKKD